MKILNLRWSALCAFIIALQIFMASHVTAQEDDPDTKALAEFRLTDEGLQNFTEASRNLVAAVKADSSLDGALEGANEGTIEETAALYDAEPAVREAIESADMTSAEYITFMYSMIQAGMGAWLVDEYGADKLPEGTPPENVDYYLANKEKIAAVTEEMQQASEGAEVE